MFIPASRASARVAAVSSAEGAKETGSTGYQHPPRQNTGVPLTTSWKPPSWSSTSTVRKPTCPRSNRADPIVADTGYSGWAPWVCGHHGSTAGRDSAARATRCSPSGSSSTVSGTLTPPTSTAATRTGSGPVVAPHLDRHRSPGPTPSGDGRPGVEEPVDELGATPTGAG